MSYKAGHRTHGNEEQQGETEHYETTMRYLFMADSSKSRDMTGAMVSTAAAEAMKARESFIAQSKA